MGQTTSAFRRQSAVAEDLTLKGTVRVIRVNGMQRQLTPKVRIYSTMQSE